MFEAHEAHRLVVLLTHEAWCVWIPGPVGLQCMVQEATHTVAHGSGGYPHGCPRVQEYGKGMSFCLFEVKSRIDSFSSVPLRFWGWGHHVSDKAVEALVDCLFQVADIIESEDFVALDYDVLVDYFTPDGTYYQDVLDVVNGRVQPCNASPSLRRYRYIAQLLGIDESMIERAHAEVHQHIKTAPHHNEIFVSSHLRRHGVLQYMKDPDQAMHFLDTLRSSCSPVSCLDSLHMTAHPYLVDHWRDGRLASTIPIPKVSKVIYRGDTLSQFMNLDESVIHMPGDGPDGDDGGGGGGDDNDGGPGDDADGGLDEHNAGAAPHDAGAGSGAAPSSGGAAGSHGAPSAAPSASTSATGASGSTGKSGDAGGAGDDGGKSPGGTGSKLEPDDANEHSSAEIL